MQGEFGEEGGARYGRSYGHGRNLDLSVMGRKGGFLGDS